VCASMAITANGAEASQMTRRIDHKLMRGI
jgi:hypothetical protein